MTAMQSRQDGLGVASICEGIFSSQPIHAQVQMMPAQPSRPYQAGRSVRPGRAMRLAAWLRRHQVVCVLGALLTLYASVALAPGWGRATGVAGESQACIVITTEYASVRYLAHNLKGMYVLRVSHIQKPAAGETGTLVEGLCLDGLNSEYQVGAAVSFRTHEAPTRIDQVCLAGDTRPRLEDLSTCIPLQDDWQEAPLYRASWQYVHKLLPVKSENAATRIGAFVDALKALERSTWLADGREYLWEYYIDRIGVDDLADPELPAGFIQAYDEAVREVLDPADHPCAPEMRFRIHQGGYRRTSLDERRVAALVKWNLQSYLVRWLWNSQEIPEGRTAAMLTPWLAMVSVNPYQAIRTLSQLDQSNLSPSIQGWIGRHMSVHLAQNWQSAVHGTQKREQTTVVRWEMEQLTQAMELVGAYGGSEGQPVLAALYDELRNKDTALEATVCSDLVERTMGALLRCTNGGAFDAALGLWNEGHRGEPLAVALLETCPDQFLPIYLSAVQENRFYGDLAYLQVLPEAQREAAVVSLIQAGVQDGFDCLSSDRVRQPDLFPEVYHAWLAGGAEHDRWSSRLYRATQVSFESSAEFEAWYWQRLCETAAAPALEQRVGELLEQMTAAELATREAAQAALRAEGSLALTAVARIERSSKELMVRDAARSVLRTTPPAVAMLFERPSSIWQTERSGEPGIREITDDSFYEGEVSMELVID